MSLTRLSSLALTLNGMIGTFNGGRTSKLKVVWHLTGPGTVGFDIEII
jgi:hypothetical protein